MFFLTYFWLCLKLSQTLEVTFVLLNDIKQVYLSVLSGSDSGDELDEDDMDMGSDFEVLDECDSQMPAVVWQ